MRYHSLAVEEGIYLSRLPRCRGRRDYGDSARDHPTEGIQFHPESIMTPLGKDAAEFFKHDIGVKPNRGRNLPCSRITGNHHQPNQFDQFQMSEMMTEIFDGNITDGPGEGHDGSPGHQRRNR